MEMYNNKDNGEWIEGKGQIVIRSSFKPRNGWDKAFAEMAKNGDDKLMFDDVFEDEDFEEWK